MKRLAWMVAVAGLAGCAAMGPDYQRPPVVLPPAYTEASGGSAVLQGDWWTAYGDAELNRLVARALLANADIAQAVARLEQSVATRREVNASRVRGSATVRGSGASVNSEGINEGDLSLTLTASYEFDFWGRLRRGDEAAWANFLATQAAADTVRLTVAASVTQGWFALGALDAQSAALRRTLKSREEGVRVIDLRVRAGTASWLDLDQAELQRADAALQLRDLQRQRARAVSLLGLLTADPALVLPQGPDLRGVMPLLPPAGLPSSLLERRPDVQRAEQLLVSANAQIGVARAAMFPQISLTGLLGGESVPLTDLLKNPGNFWSVGFGLTLPLFEQGRLQARVDQAGARQREAVAAYQEAVAVAFKDVADALAEVSAARESQPDVRLREQAAERALTLAQARFDTGYSSYLELLESQRTATNAQLASVRNRQAQLDASVDLVRALGGGWAGLPKD
jgi:outer membrane protein, multidrug efflux system